MQHRHGVDDDFHEQQQQYEQHEQQQRAHKRQRVSRPHSWQQSRMKTAKNMRSVRQREPLSATLVLDEPDGLDGFDGLDGLDELDGRAARFDDEGGGEDTGRGRGVKARGEVGVLSGDLFDELFADSLVLLSSSTSSLSSLSSPSSSSSSSSSSLDREVGDELNVTDNQIFHVAICPWLPSSMCTPHAARWTILPVRRACDGDFVGTGSTGFRRHSSLRVSAGSIVGRSFVRDGMRGGLMGGAEGLGQQQRQQQEEEEGGGGSVQIRVLDVVPIGLETVFIRVDAGALRKLDAMQAKYSGGFTVGGGKKKMKESTATRGARDNKKGHATAAKTGLNGTVAPADTVDGTEHDDNNDGNNDDIDRSSASEAHWEDAVRGALKTSRIVRADDLLPLPLPAHPVTHVPPPPARVLACEPVSQGFMLPSTRVVMVKAHDSENMTKAIVSTWTTENTITAGSTMGNSSGKEASLDDGDKSETSDSEAGDLSDDSEDVISLSVPPLASRSPGFSSSIPSATSQPIGSLADGVASPISVASAFTASTVRPAGAASASRTLRTQGLLEVIPDELLHPRPAAEDDEEARVYVETSVLVKLRCYSGDWILMEPTADPGISSQSIGTQVSDGLLQKDVESPARRPVKIFSLPGSKVTTGPRRKASSQAQYGRKSSFSHASPAPESMVYLSPILLASLGQASHVKLSPISSLSAPLSASHRNTRKPRVKSSSSPPLAKEVTLVKLASPLSTDRALQPSLFAGLKAYFERKRRIVKNGDLIGITFDESLGRALHDDSATEDGAAKANDALIALKNNADDWAVGSSSANLRAAWFRVEHTGAAASHSSDGDDGDDADDNSVNESHFANDDDDVWNGVVCIDSSNTKMVQAGTDIGRLPSTLVNPWQYYLRTRELPSKSVTASSKGLIVAQMPIPHVSSLRVRLRQLISSATSERALYFGLPPSAILITSTQRQMGKSTVAIRACEDLGLHVFPIDAFDVDSESSGGADVKAEGLLKARAERALSCGAQHTVLLIKHVEALTAERMIKALSDIIDDFRAVVFTTTEVEKIQETVRSLFTHELEMAAPDEVEREWILRDICQDYGLRLAVDVNLADVALKTAALVARDLVDVVERAVFAKRERLHKLASTMRSSSEDDVEKEPILSANVASVTDIELAGGEAALSIMKADFDAAVSSARKTFADAIGAPKIPNVAWSDVGGLAHVKSAVMETIHLPLSRPELFAKGLKKRSGILFYGPPGTGKTLVAKAIATEFSLNFFSVKGPELLNMYIGESEANVRRVFQRARDARPCVVFFDELDSVAPKRGNQGDSGGVMDRIVSQLLAELDGMSGGGSSGSDGVSGNEASSNTESSGVFVIGATNRPDLLDQALLRPGRFDKMLYLGVADTHEKQLRIIEALTRK